MARPRLGDEERRARTVGVRVMAAEAEELRERAQAARLSMGAYLRRRALGQRVRIGAERCLRSRAEWHAKARDYAEIMTKVSALSLLSNAALAWGKREDQ